MTKTVAVFPNPYLKDEWSAVMHPLLSTWAGSLKDAGWNVIGLNAEDLYNSDLVRNIGPDAIIIHWTETLTTFVINQHPSGRILTSIVSKLIPFTIRKKLANNITPSIKNKIDDWKNKLDLLNVRIFYQIHELVSHSFTEPGLAECDNYLKRNIFELSSAFLTQEESSVQLIKNFYNSDKPYSITYLGDYTKFHGEIISKEDAGVRLCLPLNSRVISYIGTARKNRNPADVAKCFLKVAKDNDRLIIAGMGVWKFLPVRSDKITVIDELIPNNKLRDIFCASDFVINDAYEYMTSAVVRTAISYHVPVIVRKYGASIDMAKDSVIYIDDSTDGLEYAITNALNLSHDDYKKLVESAELRNEERPWSQYGNAFNDLYNRLNNQ